MTNSPCTVGVVTMGTEQLHTVTILKNFNINLLQQNCEGQWGHSSELKMTDQKAHQSEVFSSSTDRKVLWCLQCFVSAFLNNSTVINTYRLPSGQKGSCLLSWNSMNSIKYCSLGLEFWNNIHLEFFLQPWSFSLIVLNILRVHVCEEGKFRVWNKPSFQIHHQMCLR